MIVLIVFFFWRQGTNNTLDIVILSIQMFWSLAAIIGVCEFGSQLSGRFVEINHVYDQFVWYLFPFNIQRILPNLITYAQKPVELSVYGTISCDRITLKSVCIIFFSF